MKAIVYTKYGGIEELQLREVEKPDPKDDEVLVKVNAVSINDWDLGLLAGDFVNRLLNGPLKPRRQILGSDIAGHVESVGKNVQRFKPGDAVYGDLSGRWGGLAEYACATENLLAIKPPTMSFEEAAAIPQAAMLAVQGLVDVGQIQQGHKVLINGAGGGVGSFAVQIAKLYGVTVTGVDHTSKLDMLRSMGFDYVIDYTQQDFTKNGQQYDLILDVKTNRSMLDYSRALTSYGTYVTVGGEMSRLVQVLLLGRWIAMNSNKKFRVVSLKPNKDLLLMNEFFEAGKTKPIIHGLYAMDDFREAFQLFTEARQLGKVVINIQ